ncbi:hypothetical protein EIP86_000542, partial [Pleurotus ostreatoroseus]
MLLHVPVGGQEEVREVLEKVPVTWKTILHSDTLYSVVELQQRVRELSAQLLDAARAGGKPALMEDSLPALLRSLGVSMAKPAPTFNKYLPKQFAAAAALADLDQDTTENLREEPDSASSVGYDVSDSALICELYAVVKKRQRPPPKDGYSFQKRDNVKST